MAMLGSDTDGFIEKNILKLMRMGKYLNQKPIGGSLKIARSSFELSGFRNFDG